MTAMRRLFLLLPLGLVLVAGCTSKTPSSVSGTVTYQGAPVTGGFILFHPKTEGKEGGGGGPLQFGINPDGTYSGANLPAEEFTVTVDTETLNPNPGGRKKIEYGGKDKAAGMGSYEEKMKAMGKMPEGGGTPGTYVKIPDKYRNKDKSPLTITLKKGKNDFSPVLED
jgi:hypothetical protein